MRSTDVTEITMESRCLNQESICANFRKVFCPWPVNPVIARGIEIQQEIQKGIRKDLDEVVFACAGDAQSGGQKPNTFVRKVLSACLRPELLQYTSEYPSDIAERVEDILSECTAHSLGCYTRGPGLQRIRVEIAKRIEKRDGFSSNPGDIFLGNGASELIKLMLGIISNPECKSNDSSKKTGVLLPCPHFQVFSMSMTEYDIHQVRYYLNVDEQWAIDVKQLEQVIRASRDICIPKAIIVINPGNPTGHLMKRNQMEEIVRFAHEQKLVLFADEVYQDNVYTGTFQSFKKVMMEMGPPYSTELELVSFMSASKGFLGECGLRGGYCELVNFHPVVNQVFSTMTSTRLCANGIGQAALYCWAKPPQPGDPSYEEFNEEINASLEDHRKNAAFLTKALNEIPGISCNRVEGSFFAFPQIHLPPAAIKEAREQNMEPDVFYALKLVERTGIVATCGSYFFSPEGKYFVRITVCERMETLKAMMDRWQHFQKEFLKEYGML